MGHGFNRFFVEIIIIIQLPVHFQITASLRILPFSGDSQ